MAAKRKIASGLFISLDGVVEAPENWHFPYLNPEMDAAVDSMHAEADTLLLGRRTYEAFAAAWPGRSGPLADRINALPKVVVSTTLDKVDWANSTVLDGDVLTALTEARQRPGRNINLSGSITLTRALLEAGLVDELRLLVHPVVLGTGKRLFPDGSGRVPLELVRSAVFSTGVMDLTYRPV